MDRKMLAITVALSVFVIAGCAKSGVDEQLVQDIPRYPNAQETESMGQSFLGGMMSANLAQYTTTDSFDEVVGFYSKALTEFETEVSTYSTEQGRQIAIDVAREKGELTIAVQEFPQDKKVSITLMWGK